jgi:hypothetical protein
MSMNMDVNQCGIAEVFKFISYYSFIAVALCQIVKCIIKFSLKLHILQTLYVCIGM